ncbi:MAG: hypothetical protein ACYDBH_25370 [Acidobacteriaceae bacterium]
MLQKFVDDSLRGQCDPVTFDLVARLIARVLEVDMSNPANRKGALPKAIGLVSRGTDADYAKQRVVYLAMDGLRWNTGEVRTVKECADIVVEALKQRDPSLTLEVVLQIYTRWARNGPGALGPAADSSRLKQVPKSSRAKSAPRKT